MSLPQPSINEFPITDKYYGDWFTIIPPISNSDGEITFSSSDTNIVQIFGSDVSIVGVGTVIITATQTETIAFSSGFKTSTFEALKANANIGSFYISDLTYGDEPYEIQPPSSNNPNPWTYSSSNTDVARIETDGTSDVIVIYSTGSATVTARQTESDFYMGSETNASFYVNKAYPNMGNFDDIEKALMDEPFEISGPTSNSDAPIIYTIANENVASITDNIVTIHNTGETNITASQEETTNYFASSVTANIVVTLVRRLYDQSDLVDYLSGSNLQVAELTNDINVTDVTILTSNLSKVILSQQISNKINILNTEYLIDVEIEKDMSNELYTNEFFNPYLYQSNYFPDMADFIEDNIVIGDKTEEERLQASYWDDWGNDVFDDWGYFYLYDVDGGKYYFPLFSPQNQADGVMTTQLFNVFGVTFTILHGYPTKGVFKFEITVSDNTFPFKFGMYGNMGSDGDENNSHLTYSFVKNGQSTTMYYVKQEEEDDDIEILYSYFIPKKRSENGSITYDLYQESSNDDNSLMSKVFTGGLSVYFSKTNDMKRWVANDFTFLS